jgi:beta-lactamase regulating signal transducer with metallopeptidase domain/biopolymer transport protein ExbD
MDSTSPLTAAFEQILRNTLWASALGILLALAWRWLPGRIRYGFGLLVICRLLMPATPVSPLSAANWWRGFPTMNSAANSPPVSVNSPAGSPPPAGAMAARAKSPAEPILGDEASGSPAPSDGLTPQSATLPDAPPVPKNSAAGFQWTMGHSAAVWLAGAALLAARLGSRQRTFNRWWKARRLAAEGPWQDSLTECLTFHTRGQSGDRDMLNAEASGGSIGTSAGSGVGNATGCSARMARWFGRKPGRTAFRHRVQIWQVPGLGSPLAVGIFRPCILVPTGLDKLLNDTERAHILQHELAHHRHHDLIWNLLLAAARVLHWFNPLIHSAASRLLREREILRDADAIQACARTRTGAGTSTLTETTASAAGAARAATHDSDSDIGTAGALESKAADDAGYGATLLKLATLLPPLRSHTPIPQPSGSALLGKHHLKQRLTMIPQHTRTTTSRPAARITFTAAALALAALTFTRAEDKAPVSTPAPASEPVPSIDPEASGVTSAKQLTTFKLMNITLPRVQFSNAHIDEVMVYLKDQAFRYDKLSEAEGKGVDMILKGDSTTPLTCDLRNVKLIDAIKVICEQAGYLYRIDTGKVQITRKDLEDRALQTRVFQINDDVARSMGWNPGKYASFTEFLTSRFGIAFPEGARATLDLNVKRLIARLPVRELDELETAVATAAHVQRTVTVAVTAQGISEYEGETPKSLTEVQFNDLLTSTFRKNPETVVRLQAYADVEYSKVAAALEKIRTAGLKNVDLAIRAEPRETPPAVAPLEPSK